MKKKKGFTLVELLVVIAILAILAAVSVVGYLEFTEKANLSNDQTTIKMINDNLQSFHVNNEPKNVDEVFSDLYSLGFTNEKLIAYSKDHKYLYNELDDKFYLADKNDDVIYPANTEKSNLWGIYRNDGINDMVSDVNKYIISTPISDLKKFTDAFKTGSFSLNLNNFVLPKISDFDNKDNIVISNGSYQEDGYLLGERLSKVVDFDPNLNIDKGVYTNIAFNKDDKINDLKPNSDGTLKLESCIFEGDDSDSNYLVNFTHSNIPNLKKLIINKSTFTNFAKWSLSVSNNTEYIVEITNNLFINTKRGVNIQFQYNNPVSNVNIIENNTFKLSNESKSNAFQIADLDEDSAASIENLNGALYDLRNNKFEQGNAFVVLHEGLAKNKLSRDLIIKAVKFSNNEINNHTFMIADPDADNEKIRILEEYISYFKN